MGMNGNRADTEKLIEFIKRQNFHFDSSYDRCVYQHMSAVITDSILQAGMNYSRVVLPRIQKLIEVYYDFRTTEDFIVLFQSMQLSQLLNWHNEVKIGRIINLTMFFYEQKISNITDLKCWLNNDANSSSLQQISGVGPKTVDYLKKLVGIDSFAIDRHLFKFLDLCGVKIDGYYEAIEIYESASKELEVDKWVLDKAIWDLMSNRNLAQINFDLN
ncbi:MAG: hypothetical protein AB9921_06235 [Erysipelotrichaceae bacterium]